MKHTLEIVSVKTTRQASYPHWRDSSLGYAGDRGMKLQKDRELNQLPDSALARGDGLRTLVANPFVGQITTGTLAAATVTRVQLSY